MQCVWWKHHNCPGIAKLVCEISFWSLKDEPRPGRSSDFDAEAVKSLVECNARHSTRELADKLNTSQSAICRHLEKMGKVSKLGVWVPQALSENHKTDRLSIATSFLSQQRNDPFLNEFITGDEKWITWDYVARKRQWVDKDKSPQPDPNLSFMAEKYCCVCGGIVAVLFILSY